jgi:hypothetical protein
MAVVAYSGNATEFAIGLIACSRHQSGGMYNPLSYSPNARHSPRMDLISAPNGGASADWMRDNIGSGSTRRDRGFRLQSEQWTGHTALFARIKGTAAWAEGWVPHHDLWSNVSSIVFKAEADGQWQDDLPMTHDPTCVSLEFITTELNAASFVKFCKERQMNFTKWSSTAYPKPEGACNCVWAAKIILTEFAQQNDLQDALSAMRKITDGSQGKLMNMILSGSWAADNTSVQPFIRSRL